MKEIEKGFWFYRMEFDLLFVWTAVGGTTIPQQLYKSISVFICPLVPRFLINQQFPQQNPQFGPIGVHISGTEYVGIHHPFQILSPIKFPTSPI